MKIQLLNYLKCFLLSRSDPAIPFNNKITLSEANFGTVEKSYIHNANDKAFGMSLQNQMVVSGNIKDVYTIESSHCPHLSKVKELTQLLIKSLYN